MIGYQTIKPEHMDEWEQLVRSGRINLYTYDPERGYVQTGRAERAVAAVRIPPPVVHGRVSHYIAGCRHTECIAAVATHIANGGAPIA